MDRLGPDACMDTAIYKPSTQTSRPWSELQANVLDGSSITESQTQQGTRGGTGGMTTGGYGTSGADQDQCEWAGDQAGNPDMDGN